MKREQIIEELKKHDGTVLSFPDRNNDWGSPKWRGNCSGWIIGFLIWKYGVRNLVELFAGSGTGSDVARDMNIQYAGYDLNPNPVRANIKTLDVLLDEVPEEVYRCDMIFAHPPYSELIKIPYAGSMYPDPSGELSKSDLGQMPWDEFMHELNKCIMTYYAALKPHAKMAVLVGDVRRNGRLYSMANDIIKPNMVQRIVKCQHNTQSGYWNKSYSGNFVPIQHEDILVFEKLSNYIINFYLPKKYELDIRDSKSASWKEVVMAVMREKKIVTLPQIYEELQGKKKTSEVNYEAKIRQTLQRLRDSGLVKSEQKGVWMVA